MAVEPSHRLLRASSDPRTVILQITGTIGWWYLDLAAVSGAMEEAEANYDRVIVEVHSPGGSVFDGWAIYNRLKRSTSYVVTKCVGIAASMGSVIMMSGKEIVMCESSIMMVHEPWTYTHGNAAELRKEAATLDKVTNVLSKAYLRKTKMDATALATMLAEETWLTPEEALAKRFIDRIEDGGDPAAPTTYGGMSKKDLVAHVRATMPDQNVNTPQPTPGAAQSLIINNKMDHKVVAVLLGLATTATVEEVQARITALVSENKTILAALDALNASQARQVAAQIDAAVSAAITEGRIVEAQRANFTELGGINFALLQSTLATLPTAAQLIPNVAATAAAPQGDRAKWTLAQWSKEDPAGLAQIHATDQAQYQAIVARR